MSGKILCVIMSLLLASNMCYANVICACPNGIDVGMYNAEWVLCHSVYDNEKERREFADCYLNH